MLLQEVEHKIITGYNVLWGDPADDTLLLGEVEDHIKTSTIHLMPSLPIEVSAVQGTKMVAINLG